MESEQALDIPPAVAAWQRPAAGARTERILFIEMPRAANDRNRTLAHDPEKWIGIG